jgi:rhodanese-related sulfurtransferase
MAIAVSSMVGGEFISYHQMSDKLLQRNIKKGLYATTDEVKEAIKTKKVLIVDVRTAEEWAGAHIKGSVRVGRQTPELAIANFALDDDDKLIYDNLIVVCNTGHRASLEAELFRKMGFKKVKVYALDEWIDECNPIATKYSIQRYKEGRNKKFGLFYSEACYNKKK